MTGTITNTRGVTIPAATLHFESEARMVVARSLVDPEREDLTVLGRDPEGRIVVRFYPHSPDGGWTFGLTLCCNAVDKGVEDGVVCRGCYGDTDVGVYSPRVADAFLGWD